MLFLIVGLAVWSFVHLIPSLMPTLKTTIKNLIGENGYKGVFSLLIVSSIVLIVFGWRSIETETLYYLGDSIHKISLLVICIAIYLFVVAQRRSRVKRLIRHPQLTGLILWSVAHVLLNGDIRSLVLFLTLAIWAVLEIILINRREGIWIKREPSGFIGEVVTIIISVFVITILYFAHPYIAGVPVSL
jgi:uncharacterized membrane protein